MYCRFNDIVFTKDAWSSLGDHSYITVTGHAIDCDFKLHSFVLDTFEMTTRHTSENLLGEISRVLSDWNLSHKHLTFVSDNANEIKHALDDHSDYE